MREPTWDVLLERRGATLFADERKMLREWQHQHDALIAACEAAVACEALPKREDLMARAALVLAKGGAK